jgi:DNA-binding NarL/FixJ family response regulator
MPTLLLIESHTALRQSLRQWLEVGPMFDVILEAGDLTHALDLAAAEPLRGIILDLDALSPAELDNGDIRRLSRLCPTAAIVGLGLDDTPAHRERAQQAGVTTFVPKSQLPTDLMPVLQTLVPGSLT